MEHVGTLALQKGTRRATERLIAERYGTGFIFSVKKFSAVRLCLSMNLPMAAADVRGGGAHCESRDSASLSAATVLGFKARTWVGRSLSPRLVKCLGFPSSVSPAFSQLVRLEPERSATSKRRPGTKRLPFPGENARSFRAIRTCGTNETKPGVSVIVRRHPTSRLLKLKLQFSRFYSCELRRSCG